MSNIGSGSNGYPSSFRFNFNRNLPNPNTSQGTSNDPQGGGNIDSLITKNGLTRRNPPQRHPKTYSGFLEQYGQEMTQLMKDISDIESKKQVAENNKNTAQIKAYTEQLKTLYSRRNVLDNVKAELDQLSAKNSSVQELASENGRRLNENRTLERVLSSMKNAQLGAEADKRYVLTQAANRLGLNGDGLSTSVLEEKLLGQPDGLMLKRIEKLKQDLANLGEVIDGRALWNSPDSTLNQRKELGQHNAEISHARKLLEDETAEFQRLTTKMNQYRTGGDELRLRIEHTEAMIQGNIWRSNQIKEKVAILNTEIAALMTGIDKELNGN